LKKVQSAKEGIMARRLCQSQQEAYSLATYFLLMNNVPTFEPADAIEKCHVFKFNNQFVSAAQKALPENRFRANIKLGNPMVEQWVRDSRYTAALIWVLIESYDLNPVEPTKEMKEDVDQLMGDTGNQMLFRIVDVTMNPDDVVLLQPEMLDRARKICPSIGHAKLKQQLQDIMDDECRENQQPSFSEATRVDLRGFQKRQHVYRSIVLKPLNQNVGYHSNRSHAFDPDYPAFSEGFHP